MGLVRAFIAILSGTVGFIIVLYILGWIATILAETVRFIFNLIRGFILWLVRKSGG